MGYNPVGNDDNSAQNNDTQTKTGATTPEKTSSMTKMSNTIWNDGFFLGFISCVLYSPFVDGNNRLSCFEISDAPPNLQKSRTISIISAIIHFFNVFPISCLMCNSFPMVKLAFN